MAAMYILLHHSSTLYTSLVSALIYHDYIHEAIDLLLLLI